MQNQRSVLPSMLALPRGGTLRADYSLIAIYLSICAAESQYAGKIVALCKPKADTETAAQAVRCARTAQAVRPVRAGSFAVNHSGELPLRAAGAQEGRQPAVFHPLVNLPFSLKGLGADGRLRKQEKGNGRGFLLPRGITPFRISAAVLLHMRVNQRRARHSSAAQILGTL